MEFQRKFNGIPMESHGFHWESFPEAPGFRPFPLEFLGKKWEFPWKWKPKWLRLQPNAFHRNSMEFHGIPTFQWESGGIRRNSWRRVKTSLMLLRQTHCVASSSPWILLPSWLLPPSGMPTSSWPLAPCHVPFLASVLLLCLWHQRDLLANELRHSWLMRRERVRSPQD